MVQCCSATSYLRTCLKCQHHNLAVRTVYADCNVQGAAKKTPLQKLHCLQNGVIFLYEIIREKICYRWYKFSAILCKFVEMVRLLVFNVLFSSERALFSI